MEQFVDISSILDGIQKSIDFDLTFDIPSDSAWDMITFPNPCTVSGNVRDEGGCITLTCTADVDYTSPCARCYKPVEGTLHLRWQKDVAVPGTLQNEDNDDYVFTEGDRLEISTLLIEQILLDFPAKILCREDCKGLCPQCGADLNQGQCSCNKKEIDPRLAILADLRDQFDD